MADLTEQNEWFEYVVDCGYLDQWAIPEFDLQDELASPDPTVIEQFVKDGGRPWDIYSAEIAMFGAPLGQLAA